MKTLILIIIYSFNLIAISSIAQEPGSPLKITAWPEADQLFHSDIRWKGADGAYSVELGNNRILWLFADTYIAFKSPFIRDECCVEMIRNSVGIQNGSNPSTASMAFYWRESYNKPASFFPEQDTTWYWPLDGIRLRDKLLIFFMELHGISTGLGFEVCGHMAVLIDNPNDDPLLWNLNRISLPSHSNHVMVGSALEEVDGYLYSFCCREPGNHDIILARWPMDSVIAGTLTSPEWWYGEPRSWAYSDDSLSKPIVLFSESATEFSVWYDSLQSVFWQTEISGFFNGQFILRQASKITGPWNQVLIYDPLIDSLPGIMVYSGKSHPQSAGTDFLFTYATNAPESLIIADTTLYYPRFILISRSLVTDSINSHHK